MRKKVITMWTQIKCILCLVLLCTTIGTLGGAYLGWVSAVAYICGDNAYYNGKKDAIRICDRDAGRMPYGK
jgi:hypothetical protein